MANGEEGFVFILNNPSLRADYVKIGCAASIAEIRSIIAANKATPEPDEIYATLKTTKHAAVARLMGKVLHHLTGKTAQEGNGYFKAKPSIAASLLEDIADIADNARIDYYVDNLPVDDEPDTAEEPAATSPDLPGKRKKSEIRMHKLVVSIKKALKYDVMEAEFKEAFDRIDQEERR